MHENAMRVVITIVLLGVDVAAPKSSPELLLYNEITVE